MASRRSIIVSHREYANMEPKEIDALHAKIGVHERFPLRSNTEDQVKKESERQKNEVEEAIITNYDLVVSLF